MTAVLGTGQAATYLNCLDVGYTCAIVVAKENKTGCRGCNSRTRVCGMLAWRTRSAGLVLISAVTLFMTQTHQYVCSGYTEVNQRLHRGQTAASQRSTKGYTEVNQRLHRGQPLVVWSRVVECFKLLLPTPHSDSGSGLSRRTLASLPHAGRLILA